jgi:hypothetical protein
MTVTPKVPPMGGLDPGSKLRTVGRAALYGLRLAIFFPMFWARFVVVPLCNLLSGALFLILLFALWAFPDKTGMLWSFAITSFVAFVVAWTYDFILALLSPQEMAVLR